jgi:tetratricopeptide (TPR) repeat protein
MRVTTVVLVMLLGVGIALAAADQAMTREQALAALADKNNAESRRLGAAWLGDMGQMQDVPLLVQALRDPDAEVSTQAEQSLWQIWGRSGDPDVDALFQRGVDQMNERDFGDAIETFSRIIQKKPEFAEGWNKRATIYYLVGEYEKSLADCEEVLRRNPVHFGVLSGFGLNYLQLSKPEQALDYFERALAVNPNLGQIQAAVEALKQFLAKRRRDSI